MSLEGDSTQLEQAESMEAQLAAQAEEIRRLSETVTRLSTEIQPSQVVRGTHAPLSPRVVGGQPLMRTIISACMLIRMI